MMATRTEAATSTSISVERLLSKRAFSFTAYYFLFDLHARKQKQRFWSERGQILPEGELLLNEEGTMDPAAT
jgi:hypothetical protein